MNGTSKTVFGHMPNGIPVEKIFLTDGPISCGIITYGGALHSLTVPDRDGRPVDVALGFDTLEDYLEQEKYIGALIGRYANRIGGSRFTLERQEYPLRSNDGPNHLHGGPEGFDKQVWQISAQTCRSVSLSLTSPDGQEGYPGTLAVTVTYTLAGRALEIAYQARSSRTTLCNLTSHAYFNLSGHGSGSIEGHWFCLLASQYTPVDENLIPTGAIESVEGTSLDLRELQPLGMREYDHNWAVDSWDSTLSPAALAWSPDTGICMETLTSLPGIQFYTGNFLNGCPRGKCGAVYGRHGAFCLETQYFPDSPNHSQFPSAVLRAGDIYESKTVYYFDTVSKRGRNES